VNCKLFKNQNRLIILQKYFPWTTRRSKLTGGFDHRAEVCHLNGRPNWAVYS